eukprot:UC4_evm1s488
MDEEFASNMNFDDLNGWESEFTRMDQAKLFNLASAASFLECDSLLDLTCSAIARTVKGKSVNALRKHFGISNDFTEAEEGALKK